MKLLYNNFRNDKIIFKLLSILLFFCAFTSCKKKKISYLRGDLESVFTKAHQAKKKVFVLVSDSTCEKCSAFEEFLNSQVATVDILERDYISYKADVRNLSEHKIVELLKTPAYPFPFFFDHRGNLIAFGFPNSKEYNISDLSKIKLEENAFSEMFNLKIGTKEYKELISKTLKATIMLSNNNETDTIKALNLLSNSLAICAYPYNVQIINILAQKPYLDIASVRLPRDYTITSSDRFLYGDVKKYMGIKEDYNLKLKSIVSFQDYEFNDNGKNLGKITKGVTYPFSFSIKNKSLNKLTVMDVNHPCDCIKLKWSKRPLGKNQATEIHGNFTPYQAGSFEKDIFVHSNSKSQPMGVYKIRGVVE